MTPIKIILHPTDFSPLSHCALETACALARATGARLLVLHVVPLVPPATGPGGDDLRRAERVEYDVRAYREEMADHLRGLTSPDPSVPLERILKEGGVATEIIRTAQEYACDLIVMGTHGRTGEMKWLMGSVAEAVLRQAPCRVLTVRASLAAEPAGRSV